MAGKRDIETLKSLGFSPERIATRLGMSRKTVDDYLQTIAKEERQRKHETVRSLLKQREERHKR